MYSCIAVSFNSVSGLSIEDLLVCYLLKKRIDKLGHILV
jgi:hypothetical protein